ncbi:hypothetical protein S83_055515, partial [Arachis hypogaea]
RQLYCCFNFNIVSWVTEILQAFMSSLIADVSRFRYLDVHCWIARSNSLLLSMLRTITATTVGIMLRSSAPAMTSRTGKISRSRTPQIFIIRINVASN